MILFLGSEALTDIDIYDEGIRLYGGMRVLQGARPYQDFFTLYGPAQFYWPAAWFAVFGEQLWAARLGELSFAVLAVALMGAFSSRGGVGWAGIVWVVCSILLPFVDVQLITLDPSLALDLAAGIIISTRTTSPRLVVAGLLLGIASLFRHDFALYGAVATAATIAVRSMATNVTIGGRLRLVARQTSIVASAALLVAAPAYALLALPNPSALWDCLVVKPPELMAFRRIPYSRTLALEFVDLYRVPSPNNFVRLWVMLGPLLAAAAFLVLLLHSRLRTEVLSDERRASALTFLMTMAGGLSLYALVRSDTFHAYPMHVVTSGALAIVTGVAMRAVSSRRVSTGIQAAFSTVVCVTLAAALVSTVGRLTSRSTVDSGRIRGIRSNYVGKWLAQAVADLDGFARDGPIFVGSVRHDRILVNPMTAYFMAGRASATYYQDLVPGLTTTEPVQRLMIEEIAESDVCAVLLWGTSFVPEPSPSGVVDGSTLLDEFLRRHFRVAVERKEYRVLTRCDPSRAE